MEQTQRHRNEKGRRTYRLPDRCRRSHRCGQSKRRGWNSTGHGRRARRRRSRDRPEARPRSTRRGPSQQRPAEPSAGAWGRPRVALPGSSPWARVRAPRGRRGASGGRWIPNSPWGSGRLGSQTRLRGVEGKTKRRQSNRVLYDEVALSSWKLLRKATKGVGRHQEFNLDRSSRIAAVDQATISLSFPYFSWIINL